MWQCSFAGFFDKFRITKCGKVILLQSVTDCYYKVRQVLQIVTVVTKWDVTLLSDFRIFNAQNLNFSIKDFFSKCDQIRSFLQIWPHLLKKSLMKNLIFSTVEFLGKALQKILVLSKDSRVQPVSFLENELPPFWRHLEKTFWCSFSRLHSILFSFTLNHPEAATKKLFLNFENVTKDGL